jgi:hypothetical protein
VFNESGNDDPFYNDVIDSWNEAGIIPVFAIGMLYYTKHVKIPFLKPLT